MRLVVCSSDQAWSGEGAPSTSPWLIASLGVFPLQSQDRLGEHRICFTFSCDIVLSHVLKSNGLHGLFRALRAYLFGQVTNEVESSSPAVTVTEMS